MAELNFRITVSGDNVCPALADAVRRAVQETGADVDIRSVNYENTLQHVALAVEGYAETSPAHGPRVCPFCGDPDGLPSKAVAKYGSIPYSDIHKLVNPVGGFKVHFDCSACDSTWTEVYKLDRVQLDHTEYSRLLPDVARAVNTLLLTYGHLLRHEDLAPRSNRPNPCIGTVTDNIGLRAVRAMLEHALETADDAQAVLRKFTYGLDKENFLALAEAMLRDKTWCPQATWE